MRNSVKAASLSELMGEGFEHRTQLTLEDLPKLLGEKMPEIPYDHVGRVRLINALHQRFGPGFRNVPGIKDIMDHFDKEVHTHLVSRINHKSNEARKGS